MMKKVHFPKKISFSLAPTALVSAIEELEPACREPGNLQNTHKELAKQLRSIPPAKLQKWKMKKSAQELLPYVIIEAREDPALREKLEILIANLFPVMAPRVRVRVLSFALDWAAVRKAAYKTFSKEPPSEDMPRWLRVFWKKILRPEPPVENMVPILKENAVPLIEVLPWLELRPYTPIVEALYLAYWEQLCPEDLTTLSFPAVCDFLVSSAPPSIRGLLLAWILQEYVTDVKLALLDGPLRRVFEIGLSLWGPPNRSGWSQCAPEVSKVAVWLENDAILSAFFDEERYRWWRVLLPKIQRIARADQILLLDLGRWVAAEKEEPNQACGWYRKEAVSLPLAEPAVVWRRGEFWVELFNEKIEDWLSSASDE